MSTYVNILIAVLILYYYIYTYILCLCRVILQALCIVCTHKLSRDIDD